MKHVPLTAARSSLPRIGYEPFRTTVETTLVLLGFLSAITALVAGDVTVTLLLASLATLTMRAAAHC